MNGDHAVLQSSTGSSPPESHVPASHESAVNDSALFVPPVVAHCGPGVFQRYLEFFCAHLRNPNTRAAYATAVRDFFGWCGANRITSLETVTRLHVAAYVEERTRQLAAPTVKLRLAAVKMLLEYLRLPGGNAAEGVRGPKHVVRTGRTPVLTAQQARHLLDSITAATLSGLRDRALISVMVYTFGRVSAVVGLAMEDYHLSGNRRWVRLREKGGREHQLPLHHRAEEAVDAYLAAVEQSAANQEIERRLAGLPALADQTVRADKHAPLFRTIDKHGQITGRGMSRLTAWEMVKRRAKAAGLPDTTTNHSFRASGITIYLLNGGTIENARNIAAHASILTTQVYDRRGDAVTLEEINRIHL